jgi:glycosyltransferase involved in cell wall biosynthesis
MRLPKVAMLTNIPSPYREETHVLLNKKLGNNYHVFYCAAIEGNRLWKISEGNYNKTFLKKSILRSKEKTFYFNPDIIKSLRKFNPDVVITAGFYPTVFLAFLWCKLSGKKHVTFTDATIKREANLSFVHRLLRKIVFAGSNAFIGASNKSLELYASYNVARKKMFISCLCINNKMYEGYLNSAKEYDILWSGQFIDVKMPFFFVDVIKLVNESIPCKVRLIGSGPLKDKVLNALAESKVHFDYPGFLQQDELPAVYSSAKVLLFPTQGDAWGLVANEACAAGVPVITCDNAGSAGELIVDGYNGYILPLVKETWAKHVIKLLEDSEAYNKMSSNAVKSVGKYNYKSAVDGILKAVEFSENNERSE